MTDVPVDNTSASAAATTPPSRASAYNGLTEAEEEELRSELVKVKACSDRSLPLVDVAQGDPTI